MNQSNKGNKKASILKWVLWFLLVQFILINISGILYGYKLTHFYDTVPKSASSSKNIFTKTWKLFRGPKFQKTTISEVPHFPFETVRLKTKNELTIEAWYIPVDSARGTVILFHGLGGNKSFMLDQAYEFMYLGFNVMLMELRAHGNSGGNTTTFGVRESEEAKLAYDFIAKKGERNIVMYGFSLGAVVIAEAIYDYNIVPSRIILDAPFGSLKSHLEGRARVLGFPEEPFGLLVTFWSGVERGFNGFRHNTCKYVKMIKCPVLLQYGALDNLVTEQETDCIYKNVSSPDKRLVVYEGAAHQPLLNKDPDKWRTEVKNFLSK
jgi:uncharacterized protein